MSLGAQIGAQIGEATSRMLFPAHLTKDERALLNSAQAAGIEKWQALHVLVFLFALLPIGTLIWNGAIAVSQFFIPVKIDAPNVLTLSSNYYLVQAVLLGIVVTKEVPYGVLRLVLRRRYRLYLLYMRDKYGIDEKRANRSITIVLTVPALIFYFMCATSFVEFGEKSIRINRVLTFGTATQQYTDVDRITKLYRTPVSRSGARQPTLDVDIYFRDGDRWSSRGYPLASDLEKSQALVQFLETKTGLEAVEATGSGRQSGA